MPHTLTNIKGVMFDLDNTLFDHHRTENEALTEIHARYRSFFNGIPFKIFYDKFQYNNDFFWSKLIAGEITRWESRQSRFSKTLKDCNLDDSNAAEMFSLFLSIYVNLQYPVDGAVSTVKSLYKKDFRLGIITNGFTSVQENKIDQLGIRTYLNTIVMSEHVGVMKPHSKIFRAALEKIGCNAAECVFIGDSYEADVIGAADSGLIPVWFNPTRQSPPNENFRHFGSIAHLKEFLTLLY